MPDKLSFVLTLIIAICWIRGFWFTFQEGEIFGKPGEWMRKHFPEWVSKPLFNCPYCMSSIHGTLIFCMFLWDSPVWLWVAFCFCTCGLIATTERK